MNADDHPPLWVMTPDPDEQRVPLVAWLLGPWLWLRYRARMTVTANPAARQVVLRGTVRNTDGSRAAFTIGGPPDTTAAMLGLALSVMRAGRHVPPRALAEGLAEAAEDNPRLTVRYLRPRQ